MSSVRSNFRLVDPAMQVRKRPMPVATALQTYLNPNSSNPVYDGEFLELNSGYQVVRGSGSSAKPSFAVLDLRGQTDVQASNKLTLVMGGEYEAETRIVTTGSIVYGDFLIVADVTVDSTTKRGLIELPAGAAAYCIVGVCSKEPADGYIRFLRVPPQRIVVA